MPKITVCPYLAMFSNRKMFPPQRLDIAKGLRYVLDAAMDMAVDDQHESSLWMPHRPWDHELG